MRGQAALWFLLVFVGACRGEILYDFDGDGSLDGDDCAPSEPDVYPGAEDPYGDAIDQNCDGVDGTDTDSDGVPIEEGDCNDSDPAIHPGMAEDCTEGTADEDCDGAANALDEDCALGDDDDSSLGNDDDSAPGDDDDSSGGEHALCGAAESSLVIEQGICFVALPAGAFTMGCDSSSAGCDHPLSQPSQEVSLTRPFVLGQFELTRSQWTQLGWVDPSAYSCGDVTADCSNFPVVNVNWWQALQFANALSEQADLSPCYDSKAIEGVLNINGESSIYDCEGYRLPTEAEWEYAARAGQSVLFAGSENVSEVGWSGANNVTHPQEVGQLQPNAWGFYDMSGNVMEWVNDGPAPYSGGQQVDPLLAPVVDPESETSYEKERVKRGGHYGHPEQDLRVHYRNLGALNQIGLGNNGLRLARTLSEAESAELIRRPPPGFSRDMP